MRFAKEKTIERLFFGVWMAAAVASAATAAIISIAFSYSDYKTANEKIRNRLEEKIVPVARRIQAEVLVGNERALIGLASTLAHDHNLDHVSVLTGSAPCDAATRPCFIQDARGLHAYLQNYTTLGTYSVEVGEKTPTFLETLELLKIAGVSGSVLLLLVIAILIQRYLLKKYLVDPVRNLTANSIDAPELPKNAPVELHELSSRLQEAIESRDKVVYGQFASGILHDLRTRLSSIANAQALVEEVDEKDREKRVKRLELLERAVDHNLPRVNELIQKSLDGARDISVQKTESDISTTIQDSIDSTRDFAKDKNVSITFKNDKSNVDVKHDSIQLERVFSNLLKNAIEAFESGDASKERVVNVSLNSEDDKNISISVEDNGPGIDDVKSKLFKLSTTTKSHGTGLGLLISKKIVEGHKGKIRAGKSSTLGGARFTIELPYHDKEGTT